MIGAGGPKPRQAMLLAAGLGTRLRPLTDRVPKCMVRVGGRPILGHVIARLRSQGVTELVINTHHLPDVVTEYFGDGSASGVHISWSHEAVLLGTAGSVRASAAHFDGPFFVWYADNLSTCKLDAMWLHHRRRRAILTMALFERRDPTSSGIAALDVDSMITRFREKPRPEEAFSNLVNAGIMILEPEAVDAIPERAFADFASDVLPVLIESRQRVAGYVMGPDEHLLWADRPADLEVMAAMMEVFQP